MKPHLCVIDDIFILPAYIRNTIIAKGFMDITSPIDGVTYPGMCDLNDTHAEALFKDKLSKLFGQPTVRHCFARLMTKDMTQPHKIHSDESMGQYSAHVYLSRLAPSSAGTAFWQKAGQQANNPPLESQEDFTGPDWEIWHKVGWRYNRLVVHRSDFFHSASPSEGWGSGAGDGRLVMTMFFDLEDA